MRSCGLNELVTTSLIGKPLLKQFDMTYDEENVIEVEHPNLDKPTIVFAAEPPGVSVSPLMKLSSSFEAMFSTEYNLSTFNAPNPITSAFKSS